VISLQTITGSASEAGGYLRQGQDVERYYNDRTRETEIERGVYFGGKSLGLHGRVAGAELTNILDGRREDGSKLYERGHTGRRVGFDITFSPDKSFGLLWARVDDATRKKLEDTLRHSVEDTLSYAQEKVLDTCVRRGHAGAQVEAPKDLTFALFQHGTSRENDPQPHVHAILMNFAERADGSYGAINEKALFHRQMELRRVFNLTLAARLKGELGIEVEAHKDGIRVVGIDRDLCDVYSKRTHQIRSALDEIGLTPSQAKKFAVLQTRNQKSATSERDLLPEWQKDFDSRGFTEEKGRALLGRTCLEVLREEMERGQIDACVKAMGESTRNLNETQLRALVSEKFAGFIRLEDLDSKVERLKSDERVLAVELSNGGKAYTTEAALALEKKAVSIGSELGSRAGHAVDFLQLEAILDRYSKTGMSEEQRAATEHVLKSSDLTMLVGAAGTGKSFSLQAAREVLEASGYTVRGLAPTGKAAQNLEEASGIVSKTVDKFLYDADKSKDTLRSTDVVIVDEAAMLGNDKMRMLLEKVQDSGAKVILVGDHKQLAPIERGRPFEHIKAAVGAFEITTIRRQAHEWQREAANKVREGSVRDALVAYHEQGLVRHGSSFAQVRDMLVEDWMKDRKERPFDTQLVLASTREKVEGVNRAIRGRLVEDGVLSLKKEAKIGIIQNDGMAVPRGFVEKDRLYFTKNDERIGVKNGALGTIEKITRVKRGVFEFGVKLDEGSHVVFRSDRYAHIAHGYATTIHKSQGDTVDRSYILPERMMDRQGAYVAFTRHREEARVYASTELVHGYVRAYTEEKATEAKVKLHIDRITQSIEAHEKVGLGEGLPAIPPPPEVKEERTYVTDKHLEAGKALASQSRSVVTQALYELATEPKGVEHRYSRFDGKIAMFQQDAARLLKSQVYDAEKLRALSELVASLPVGREPLLTDKERSAHYTKVHASVADRERALAVGREMETHFLTRSQRELLGEVVSPEVPEHRVEALRDLALSPPTVGKEHGKSADPWKVNRESSDLLKAAGGFDERKAVAWAKNLLGASLPEGQELERPHKDTYLAMVKDRTSRVLLEYGARREQERQTHFATPEHRELAGMVLDKSIRFDTRVGALERLAYARPGVGTDFREGLPHPAPWQKAALSIAKRAEQGHGFPPLEDVERIVQMVAKAPLGKPPEKGHAKGVAFSASDEATFKKGFAILVQEASRLEHDKDKQRAQESSREKNKERGRGFSLGL